jgi:hypothetical protein
LRRLRHDGATTSLHEPPFDGEASRDGLPEWVPYDASEDDLMNHYTAFQPPHLDGQWQYAMLGKRGGGPICGCEHDHATQEEAERHLYETALANAHVHSWETPDEQRKCEICDEWTTFKTVVRLRHIHNDVHVLCTAHQVREGDSDAVRAMIPFQPGVESFGTY